MDACQNVTLCPPKAPLRLRRGAKIRLSGVQIRRACQNIRTPPGNLSMITSPACCNSASERKELPSLNAIAKRIPICTASPRRSFPRRHVFVQCSFRSPPNSPKVEQEGGPPCRFPTISRPFQTTSQTFPHHFIAFRDHFPAFQDRFTTVSSPIRIVS